MAEERTFELPDWALHALLILFHILGAVGILLIVYGLVSAITHEPWPPLEHIASPISSTLTLIGTAATAASIYVFGVPIHPPAPFNKWFTAPLVIASAVAAIYFVWTSPVPPIVINGFSALGLAGALFRIIPRPKLFGQISN
jgi:hypothetical protein